jgi:hypothetical protein
MQVFRKIASLSVMLVVLAVVGFAPFVQAESNGLGITPRKDYVVKPDEKRDDTLFISNLSTAQSLRITMEALDFSPKDETGTPSLQLDPNASQTPWSLKPFLTFPKEVVIAPGKSANVPISIKIPGGQGAGSYYGAIRYSAENAETKQKVNIAASSVSLLFVTIPGQAKERLALEQFGAYKSDGAGGGVFKSLFVSEHPQNLAYRFKNEGNVAERPEGSIIIKNMFGKTAVTIERANPKSQLALIGQTRRIDLCMKSEKQTKTDAVTNQQSQETVCKNPGLWPGRYTAEIMLVYGMNGSITQEVTGTASFWYLPWWFIISLIVVLLLIVLAIWTIHRRITRPRRGHFRR